MPDPRKYKDPATSVIKGKLPIWSLQQPPIEFLLVGKRRNACRAARRNDTADVAQLVEHHLAKVDVASSNLVVRSQGTVKARIPRKFAYTVGWPRGEAAACKAVYTGSNPVPTSVKTMSSSSWLDAWAIGAAVARFPDTEEVTGSIPVSPTRTRQLVCC
jgi:hypothetical protein